jgi:tetratricopeptide (TPR) repeat protein
MEDKSLVFRPKGIDFGGRAYLEIQALKDQEVLLNFLLSKKFYEGLKKLKNNQAREALPLIEPEARHFLGYIGLSSLPGNYVSTVRTYLEVLQKTGNWTRLTTLLVPLPMGEVPPEILSDIGQITLAMHEAQQFTALESINRSLLAMDGITPAQLKVFLSLADSWREIGQYERAFEIYLRASVEKSNLQEGAQLWATYCGFYLEDSEWLQSIMEDLPIIQPDEPYFALRELIEARWKARQAEYPAAMRAAARGKTHAAATDPSYPELLHTLGLLYAQMEMPEAATLAHQEVSIMFPSSQWGAKSLEIIQQQNKKAPKL